MSKVNGHRSIVITGAQGFVGTYLREELQRSWKDVQIISWDLPQVDIIKPETYQEELQKVQPSWIVHLAAVSSVSAAAKDPKGAHRVNVEATEQLLESVAAGSPKTRVFIVSSADIYGIASPEPLPERPLSAAQPHNAYGASKLAMEEMIEQRFRERCLRVRPFPHIGPGQRPGFVTADFASQIAAIERGKQDPVMLVGNLEAQRDFTDVRDVVRAYRLLLEQGEAGEVYHVASGRAVKIEQVLEMLLSFSMATIEVRQDPAKIRPSDNPIIVGDASKLTKLTGWQPEIPLETSLREILEWWRSHSDPIGR